ncbi:hypothetical protein OPV22_022941 [Ensete ventricosum]|uniref:Uncharacterized protein n=1 Tax=Ensete ventricosum TaxID=4639 RepID=A0AAV8QVJ2_ENSVE|nr:hypothetical protein OPV22_022941 [Ensete ventricosum]
MGDRGVVGVADDMGEGMQCVDHPYRSNPGGVCAFCLQEKLGKLVSSSKSSPFSPLQPPPSSSASPTSFRSDAGVAGGGLGLGLGLASGPSRTGTAAGGRRSKFPFLAASHSKKKKNKNSGGSGGYGNVGRKVMASVSTAAGITDSGSAANDSGIVLKRSKSTAPRTAGTLAQGRRGGGGIGDPAVAESPRKKSFWSFLYLSSASSSSSAAYSSNINRRKSTSSSSGEGCDEDVNMKLRLQRQANASHKLVAKEEAAPAAPEQGENGVKEAESPNAGQAAASSFGRKVARSRSVGCGSRSFSGDFLERISTGFGDCTLRRVESQREAKPNIGLHLSHDNDGEQQQPRMKERFKCGGLFGGFGTMYAYWLSAAAAEDDLHSNSRTSTATPAPSATAAARGRTRSWSLAFASPMRAFRPYSSSKPLYAIHNAASAAPATNIISSINASNGGKGHKPHTHPSFLAVES